MKKEKRKLRIGWMSDSPFLCTGYATISFNVCNALAEAGHEVHFFPHNYVGQTLMPGIEFEDGKKLNFKLHGAGREQYRKDIMEHDIKKLNLDVFIILLDTFMLYPWLLEKDFAPAKSIFYFPSDGGSGMPLGCEQILRHMDMPIAMAKFGRDQCKKMYNIDTGYIPHAIDVDLYKPISAEEKEQLKARWGLQGKYVVGTVARNQGRKMLDRTVKAFALYAKTNPDAVLMMHTDPNDAAAMFPIKNLIQRYGVENRVMFTGMTFFNGFDYKQMGDVYNVMDVFLLSTSGEGFGVPLIEAMGCGIPVVATDYTTTEEIVLANNAGLGIDLVGTEKEENPRVHCEEILDGTITGSWMVERGLCSLKHCAEQLTKLEDPKLREELGKNGREAALRDYDWKNVGKEWVKTIEKLGEEI